MNIFTTKLSIIDPNNPQPETIDEPMWFAKSEMEGLLFLLLF